MCFVSLDHTHCVYNLEQASAIFQSNPYRMSAKLYFRLIQMQKPKVCQGRLTPLSLSVSSCTSQYCTLFYTWNVSRAMPGLKGLAVHVIWLLGSDIFGKHVLSASKVLQWEKRYHVKLCRPAHIVFLKLNVSQHVVCQVPGSLILAVPGRKQDWRLTVPEVGHHMFQPVVMVVGWRLFWIRERRSPRQRG